jgi:outer membrane protein OmpA-like peptidoglycan-associated protein
MRVTHSATTLCAFGLLALVSTGCATQQQRLELETAFRARVDKIEADLASQKQDLAAERRRVDDLSKQLGQVRATADEATRIGTDARLRADAAMNQGAAVDARVTKALANRLKRAPVQEFRVTFETGRAELSLRAQETLTAAVTLLAQDATYTADVIGFTDDVGAAGSNVWLSWRREEMVRRFMVERGSELNRFSFIGLGEDRAKGSTDATRAMDRHVVVRIHKPVE